MTGRPVFARRPGETDAELRARLNAHTRHDLKTNPWIRCPQCQGWGVVPGSPTVGLQQGLQQVNTCPLCGGCDRTEMPVHSHRARLAERRPTQAEQTEVRLETAVRAGFPKEGLIDSITSAADALLQGER